MFLNLLINKTQKVLTPLYKKSYLLRNIDWLIFLSITLVMLSSTYLSSDFIGYIAIILIFFTGVKFLTKPNEKIRLTKAEIFLLLYFLLVLISVAGSTLLTLSLKGFFKTLTYIGFYFGVVSYLKDNQSRLKYILLILGIIVLGESIIALEQNYLSVAEISGWQDLSRLNPEEVMTRVYGSIKPYNPNLFGGYMLALLPTTLILIFLPLKNKHYKTALFGFIIFILGISAILMTGCRGAYLGLLIELALLTLFTYKFLKPVYKKLFLIISTFLSSIAFLFIISISSLRSRIFSIFAMRNDSSNSFRFNVYNSCIEMFKDNWLLGIGVGNQNFREIYGLYMKTGFDALSAYNIYLETAVESGIFALIAFMSFIIINLSNSLKYIFRRKNIKTLYLIIATVSTIGLLIHGLVDTVFYRPQIQFIFWLMMAIITVLTSNRGSYARKRNN